MGIVLVQLPATNPIYHFSFYGYFLCRLGNCSSCPAQRLAYSYPFRVYSSRSSSYFSFWLITVPRLKHRLFLAIDIPDSVCDEIVVLQNKLNSLHIPVLWEPPEKLHLTLNFLGEIANPQIPDINQVVSSISKNFSQFSLVPTFLETLYQRHEQSLVYLSVTGDTRELIELQEQLSESLNEIKLPQPRRFLPQITIGRLQKVDPIMAKASLDKVDDFEFSPLTPFTVKDITMFESFVTKVGTTYQRAGKFTLQV